MYVGTCSFRANTLRVSVVSESLYCSGVLRLDSHPICLDGMLEPSSSTAIGF